MDTQSNTRPSSVFAKAIEKGIVDSPARGTKRGRTIEEQFDAYHAANPEIYDFLVDYAREAKAAGHKRFGIQALAERVRWEVMVRTQAGSGFKLPNAVLSRYARLIMEQESDLKGFFATRPLRSL